MNKILFILLLGALVVPALVLAQTGPQECCKLNQAITIAPGETYAANACVGDPAATAATCSCGVPTGANATTKWGLICALNVIYTLVNWIFLFLVIVAIALTLMGAWDIMQSGDPAKTVSGRNKIVVAAIGLLVAFAAKAIPSFVRYFLGAA
jgi:hypothetical protein